MQLHYGAIQTDHLMLILLSDQEAKSVAKIRDVREISKSKA